MTGHAAIIQQFYIKIDLQLFLEEWAIITKAENQEIVLIRYSLLIYTIMVFAVLKCIIKIVLNLDDVIQLLY